MGLAELPEDQTLPNHSAELMNSMLKSTRRPRDQASASIIICTWWQRAVLYGLPPTYGKAGWRRCSCHFQ
jgi:hypothetical protein